MYKIIQPQYLGFLNILSFMSLYIDKSLPSAQADLCSVILKQTSNTITITLGSSDHPQRSNYLFLPKECLVPGSKVVGK